MSIGGFRFGVNMLTPASRDEWVAKCRKAEELGYDVVGVADHLGMPAPFPALVLAAEATERVRLNTFVLNAAFYHPVLLAREVASTDQFVDGRLELGIGAGYVKAEFDAAGMPFPTAAARVGHLERTVKELKDLFADTEHKPSPAQAGGPPLMIAGRGDRVLTLAAEHADIVAFSGALAPERDGEFPKIADAADIEERTGFVRGKLGDRAGDVEFNLLVHFVELTDDRDAGVETVLGFAPWLTAEQVLDVPSLLIGTARQVAEKLTEARERFGLSYFTMTEPNLEKFAPVIALLK